MMRKQSILLAVLTVFLLFAGCTQQQTEDMQQPQAQVQPGKYEMEASEEPLKPYVMLEENQTFQMMYSALMSYLPLGTYEVKEDSVVLTTEDGERHYTFRIDGDTLVFRKDKSSSVKFGKEELMPDGAVFRLKQES
ncbi:MAG: hypothetical protein HFI90_08940 [Clostridia bacterium]|nr:hypothetical protein [Clostridia bacterium]